MELTTARAQTFLWASLTSDNETLITNFLASKGWSYATFVSIMKTLQTTSVFHAAVGKGKHRIQQYKTVVQLILDAAKVSWLEVTTEYREYLKAALAPYKMASVYPFSCSIGELDAMACTLRGDVQAECKGAQELVVLKKRLGGFYLLYTLFFKQPDFGANLIRLAEDDFGKIREFETQMRTPFGSKWKVLECYNLMLARLKLNSAFDFQLFGDEYNFDYSTRIYLNTKNDTHVGLLKLCKQLHDELSHNQHLRAGQRKMIDYFQQKTKLAVLFKSEQGDDVEEDGNSFIAHLQETSVRIGEQLKVVVETLKDIGDIPLLSRSALLGNERIEHVLVSEAMKRKQRLEQKEKKTTTAQRYDRDIFGSKKMSEATEEPMVRRGRSQAATNLWSHYIPEEFDFTIVTEAEEKESGRAAPEAGGVKPKRARKPSTQKSVTTPSVPKAPRVRTARKPTAAPSVAIPQGPAPAVKKALPKRKKKRAVVVREASAPEESPLIFRTTRSGRKVRGFAANAFRQPRRNVKKPKVPQ